MHTFAATAIVLGGTAPAADNDNGLEIEWKRIGETEIIRLLCGSMPSAECQEGEDRRSRTGW